MAASTAREAQVNVTIICSFNIINRKIKVTIDKKCYWRTKLWCIDAYTHSSRTFKSATSKDMTNLTSNKSHQQLRCFVSNQRAASPRATHKCRSPLSALNILGLLLFDRPTPVFSASGAHLCQCLLSVYAAGIEKTSTSLLDVICIRLWISFGQPKIRYRRCRTNDGSRFSCDLNRIQLLSLRFHVCCQGDS